MADTTSEQTAAEQTAAADHTAAAEQTVAAEQTAAEQTAAEQTAAEQTAAEQPIPEPPYSGYVDAIVQIISTETIYLNCILSYTRRSNPKIPFVVIGNACHCDLVTARGGQFVDIATLTPDLSYGYVHVSPNPPEYEKARFDRWLILNEYVKQSPYNKIFFSDYDNAFFIDVNRITAIYDNPRCIYVGNDNVCVPNMIFMTKDICNGIETYLREYFKGLEEGLEGLEGATGVGVPLSDIWLLREGVRAEEGNGGVYRMGDSAEYVVDVDYSVVRERIEMVEGIGHLNGVVICNIYMHGDSKNYPYGDN